jgi:hypothetical protein
MAGAEFTDFPFSIDARGRSATTDPGDHVRDLIHQVLFTTPGERVNRPEFGCGVKQLVFAPASDALAASTEQLIHGSLIRWLDTVISVEGGLSQTRYRRETPGSLRAFGRGMR